MLEPACVPLASRNKISAPWSALARSPVRDMRCRRRIGVHAYLPPGRLSLSDAVHALPGSHRGRSKRDVREGRAPPARGASRALERAPPRPSSPIATRARSGFDRERVERGQLEFAECRRASCSPPHRHQLRVKNGWVASALRTSERRRVQSARALLQWMLQTQRPRWSSCVASCFLEEARVPNGAASQARGQAARHPAAAGRAVAAASAHVSTLYNRVNGSSPALDRQLVLGGLLQKLDNFWDRRGLAAWNTAADAGSGHLSGGGLYDIDRPFHQTLPLRRLADLACSQTSETSLPLHTAALRHLLRAPCTFRRPRVHCMAFAFLPFSYLNAYALSTQFALLLALVALSYRYRCPRLALLAALALYTA
ncbi:hypothetical protein B0H15DRAFT_957507 [Mycena belliarum]|uniref:Uncharacterized protein n=1 Tax=Mycena belliarum TaxID=1033014 RepID=A0AAD6TQZ6_9AGAR|nr:hypothetical protein B0H15DRAFT_957507 [Mycena belliae]